MTSSAPRLLRIAFIFVGAALFIWLSLEDQNERRALLLAAFLSSLIAIALYIRMRDGRLGVYSIPLLGAFSGLLVPVLAVLLMVVKTGLHGHDGPDFTIAQISTVLQRIPVWIAAGFLVGLGVAVWHAVRAKPA